jgi:hypothetical protein
VVTEAMQYLAQPFTRSVFAAFNVGIELRDIMDPQLLLHF